MKKILILAIGIILSVGSMAAQERQRGGGRQFSAKERVESLKKELKLSDEQTEQITTLYNEFAEKMNGADRGNREQMRSEMEKLNKSVESLLDEDQKKAFKKLQNRQRGGNRGGGNRGGRGGFGGGGYGGGDYGNGGNYGGDF